MDEDFVDCATTETNVRSFQCSESCCASRVFDDVFKCILYGEIADVVLLVAFVVGCILLSYGCCISRIEGVGGVCSWIDRCRFVPRRIADERSVFG
jgi:hypothetical protein